MLVKEKKDKENLRIRLDGSFKEQLDSVFGRKGISQQEAIERILRWFLSLNDIHQSIVLEQVEEEYHGHLARMLLQEIAQQDQRHAILPHAERKAAKISLEKKTRGER